MPGDEGESNPDAATLQNSRALVPAQTIWTLAQAYAENGVVGIVKRPR